MIAENIAEISAINYLKKTYQTELLGKGATHVKRWSMLKDWA